MAPAIPGTPAPIAAGTPPKYDLTNFNAAHQALTMTPQEQGLYMHHLGQTVAPATNPDGAPATVAPLNLQVGNMFHNIPTVWNRQALNWDDPAQRATLLGNIQKAGGFGRFPSYPSADAADARYAAMQNYMTRDMGRSR